MSRLTFKIVFNPNWINPKGSVQSTVIPEQILSYNEWFAFIHRIKPIENTVKPGGVCLNWGMENALKEAKSILK